MRNPSSFEASDWGPFSDTVLHFCSTPALVVDLRRQVSRATRSRLREIGFERSFGIVTAENPMGVQLTPAANADLAARLQMDAAQLAVPQSCVDACSPDGSHRERSLAIALGVHSLVDLASRYGQLAIFWFDGEAFWIVPARSSKTEVRLPIQT